MKTKSLIILAVVCAVLAGAAYLTVREKPADTAQTKLGEKIFETLPVNEVTAVTILSSEDAAMLKKGDRIWEVDNRYGYPANFSKVADILKKIRDIKVGRSFPSDDDAVARLALYPPDAADKPEDQKGTRIILETGEKVIADLIFGKERDAAGGGGQYFKPASENIVYMTDSSFRTTDKKPADWLDKELFKAGAENIRQVICMNPADQSVVYKLTRPEKGESPEFIDLPKDRKPDRNKINSLFGAVSAFQTDDIADPSDEAVRKELDAVKYVEFHLFDGTVYKLYPGKALETDAEKYYLKAEVAYIRPEVKTEAPETAAKAPDAPPTPDQKVVLVPADSEGTDAPEPPKETVDYDKLAKDAEEANQKVSAWVYAVPKWRVENLIAEAEELLEKAETTEEEKK